MSRNDRSLWRDERAIEGLPIRLIIALVVGVASLGLMLNILGGVPEIGNTEVTVEFEEGRIVEDLGSDNKINMSVVDQDGNSVPGATILLEPGTAQGDTIDLEDGNEDGVITISNSDFSDRTGVELRSDQQRGTYKVSVIPPSDSDWADEQDNPEIIIISN